MQLIEIYRAKCKKAYNVFQMARIPFQILLYQPRRRTSYEDSRDAGVGQ